MITKIGTFLARPIAFLGVVALTALWLIFDRESFDWHGAVTLITLAMTLFIQRSEHRDTQAIQAKLDELLRANGGARNSLAHIDEAEPEEIERQRAVSSAGD